MLNERSDLSIALLPLGFKKYESYFAATQLVYNLSRLELPQGYGPRLFAASLYAAGKTLNSHLIEEVLAHSNEASESIAMLDELSDEPINNRWVRRLSLDLAMVNAFIQLEKLEQAGMAAESSLQLVPHLSFFEQHHRGAVGIVVMQFLVKLWSVVFADAILSKNVKRATRAHAKINRCCLALCRSWKGKIKARREMPYVVEGLVPMHLAFVIRQCFAVINTSGFDRSMVAYTAFALYYHVFRPEGPMARVKAAELSIRAYVAKQLDLEPSSVSMDPLGPVYAHVDIRQ